MAKGIELEIKKIIGQLSETNARNEQKVIAIASWNNNEDTIDIRKYNTKDEILLKGISLTPHEAEQLIYMLLESGEINVDRNKIRNILKDQEQNEIEVVDLVNSLDGTVESVNNQTGHELEGIDGFYRIALKRDTHKVRKRGLLR